MFWKLIVESTKFAMIAMQKNPALGSRKKMTKNKFLKIAKKGLTRNIRWCYIVLAQAVVANAGSRNCRLGANQ
jgi:hypothetical protein